MNETIRDSLHEAMDLEGLKTLLRKIDSGEILTVAIDTAEPSPFSHEILNANPYAYLDDAPLEERRARAVQMRRTLGIEAGEIGALDPAAIDEVFSESWPVVRDADELHDALLTLILLPPVPEWQGFFEELKSARRALSQPSSDGKGFYWIAATRSDDFRHSCHRSRMDGVHGADDRQHPLGQTNSSKNRDRSSDGQIGG